MRGRKLVTANHAAEMMARYALSQPSQPEVIAQEIIAGGDDTKYCYLPVYGLGSRRLGHSVVREFRAYPVFFGSASIVEPVVDPEIDALCDQFLRTIDYGAASSTGAISCARGRGRWSSSTLTPKTRDQP